MPPKGKRYVPPQPNANTFQTQEEFLESLQPVPRESLPDDGQKCLYCWKTYGESVDGIPAEEPVTFRCGHSYGEQCMRELFRLPPVKKVELCPLEMTPGSMGRRLGEGLKRHIDSRKEHKADKPDQSDRGSSSDSPEAIIAELLFDIVNGKRRPLVDPDWYRLIRSTLSPNVHRLLKVRFFENAIVYDTLERRFPSTVSSSQEMMLLQDLHFTSMENAQQLFAQIHQAQPQLPQAQQAQIQQPQIQQPQTQQPQTQQPQTQQPQTQQPQPQHPQPQHPQPQQPQPQQPQPQQPQTQQSTAQLLQALHQHHQAIHNILHPPSHTVHPLTHPHTFHPPAPDTVASNPPALSASHHSTNQLAMWPSNTHAPVPHTGLNTSQAHQVYVQHGHIATSMLPSLFHHQGQHPTAEAAVDPTFVSHNSHSSDSYDFDDSVNFPTWGAEELLPAAKPNHAMQHFGKPHDKDKMEAMQNKRIEELRKKAMKSLAPYATALCEVYTSYCSALLTDGKLSSKPSPPPSKRLKRTVDHHTVSAWVKIHKDNLGSTAHYVSLPHEYGTEDESDDDFGTPPPESSELAGKSVPAYFVLLSRQICPRDNCCFEQKEEKEALEKARETMVATVPTSVSWKVGGNKINSCPICKAVLFKLGGE